jgi:SAM-dependent methyltransferase
MQRIPEPELMEAQEQAEAYARADFASPHQRFVDLFGEKFPAFRAGLVLDLGCGPGDVALRFARAYPECRLHGVDGSPAMLEAAALCYARHPGLRERVQLHHGLLPDAALPAACYDAVISNSLLHHLHDPGVLWQSVARWAAPGAPVFVVDLRRPASEAEARRLTACYAAGEPAVLQHDFYHSLLAAFEPEEIRAQLLRAGLGHLEIEIPSDRHVLIWGYR